MVLLELNLINFRNYDNLKLKFNPHMNIICGDNAQGKTNLLESIYMLSLTKSHRLNNDNNLIMFGKKQSKIKGIYCHEKIKTINEIILNEKKTLLIDKNIIKKTDNYITKALDIIIFFPQDLEIIQGSPNIRRNYLNIELGQLSDNYLKILSDYNKILKIRNDYLKKMTNNIKINISYFNIITGYLIDKAFLICKMRNKFIEEINQGCNIIFNSIAEKENFFIKYITNFDFLSINFKDIMLKKYNQILKKEIKMGSTLIGPHRDDIEFILKDKNIKEFGSQGQQRIAILSMKLAEIEIFKKYKGNKPLLLLDDVFSELDNQKKKNLIKFISEDLQVIITTTDLKSINKKIYKNSNIFNIKNGIIKLEKVE